MKTGTTSLQNYVFPALSHGRWVDVNPPQLRWLIRRSIQLARAGLISEVKPLPQPSQLTLISEEGLIGIDPRNWVRHLDLVTRLFGPSARIWITLRQPEDFLRAIYQQTIQEGYVVSPLSFFLSESEYRRVNPHDLDDRRFFSSDDFDLRFLVNNYAQHFHKVVVTPLETLTRLGALSLLIPQAEQALFRAADILESRPPLKISYSARAMSLTFTRERFLNRLNLRSSPRSPQLTQDAAGWMTWRLNDLRHTPTNSQAKPHRQVGMTRRILRRVRKEALMPFGWRDLMHRMDRWFPSDTYQLPSETYLGRRCDSNRDFYREVLSRAAATGAWEVTSQPQR